MLPDNDAGNESNEISACDHHHVRLGVIWGYWVSSDKWHNVSSRNIPGSKLIYAEITVSGKKNRLGGLNCHLFTFFSRLAQASVQALYNQFSPPVNLFILAQICILKQI